MVKKVKYTLLTAVALLLLSASSFPQSTNTAPFETTRLCGMTKMPDALLELKRDGVQEAVAIGHSNEHGEFDLGYVAPGLYRLSMTWKIKGGVWEGPASNEYPVKITTGAAEFTCKSPLRIDIISGAKSRLALTFIK
jgi:hypothetical protein